MGGFDVPAVARVDKLLHGHLVAAFHLIVARGEHVIKVTAAMHVLVHIDIIWPRLQFGFKPAPAQGRLCTEFRLAHFRATAFSLSGREVNSEGPYRSSIPGILDMQLGLPKTSHSVFMSEPKVNDRMEKIVSLCKRRGLIFQSSEIYGGINGFWDYGPLGAELKRNIKDYWWRCMTQYRDDVVGLEATIIMHPKVWEASGHTSTFSDPMVDCLLSKKRFRADQIEPQSGTAYHYTGSKDETTGKQIAEAYSVLLAAGKHPDSARKVARQFYQQRGL